MKNRLVLYENSVRFIAFRLLLVFFIGLPAGPGHAGGIKIAPTAVHNPLGGGFHFSGAVLPHAQGHGSSLLPGLGSISLNLPSLPSIANLSLPQSAVTQAAAAQTAAPVRRVKRSLDVLRLGARRGAQAAGAGVLAAHGQAAALFTGYQAKKSLPVGTDFTPDPATPALPSYLKTADKEDAAWLAAVVEAAQESKTARKVLREIEELTGNGREPLIVEVEESESTDGDYTFDWELVRIARHMKGKEPYESVPAFIHELTHVVQKAQDLPFYAVELEIEAHVNQMKVAHELGVIFKSEQYHHGLSRSFKASVKGMVGALLETDQYAKSISLDENTFEALEWRLRRWEKSEQRSIDKWEAYLRERQAAFQTLKEMNLPERFLKGYRGEEILGIQRGVINGETGLHLIRRDLRILRTSIGRQRYLDFARRVYKEAQRFRRTYIRHDSENASRKNVGRIQLPSPASVTAYTSRPEPVKRKATARKKVDIPEKPSPLTGAIATQTKADRHWLGEVEKELRRSDAGAELLREIERAAGERKRPFFIEFFADSWKIQTHFRPDYDIIQVNRRDQRLTPGEFAPLLAMYLTHALRRNVFPRYALEPDIEGALKGIEVSRQLGVRLKKRSPLYEAARLLKRGPDKLIGRYVKKESGKFLLAERGVPGIRKMLERKETQLKARLKKKKAYLRKRNATYHLMREEYHTHVFQRNYRADEIIGTQSELADIETALAAVKRDREILAVEESRLRYERYADEVTANAARLHSIED